MLMELITEPGAPPIEAEDVRARLNLGDDVSDEVLGAYIQAATDQIDGWNGWLGRAIVQQQWRMTLEGFGCERIRIPLPPLVSLDEVRYFDTGGVQQVWPDNEYASLGQYLMPKSGFAYPPTQFRADAVQIDFTAGFETVPEAIKQAICLMVSNLRSLSERNLFISADTVDGVGSKQFVVGGNAAAAINAAVDALLSPYRMFA